MTVPELLARARSAIGRKTKYRMGGGSLDPRTPGPQGEDGACDCSAYATWCLGLRKYQPDLAWLRAVSGGWYSTNGIWWDAVLEQTGHFTEMWDPHPGCVIVYPSSVIAAAVRRATFDVQSAEVARAPSVGHVGIITEVRSGRPTKVVHCSAGNYRRTGDAIAETGAEVFERVDATRHAWCATVVR